MVTLLYNVLSSALHYNAALALQVLQHRHQAGWHATLHGWMQHLTTCPKLRLHDLKCGVLAVASLLALPPAQAPNPNPNPNPHPRPHPKQVGMFVGVIAGALLVNFAPLSTG